MAKKRWFKSREKGLPKGYDSKLELVLHEGPLKGCTHHSRTVKYTVDHTYEPDFIPERERDVFIEVKGRARDRAEMMKYVHVQNCNPDIKIVFILEKRNTPMPFAKARKDGSKQTHEDFLEKHGFEYYYPDTIPEKWSK